MVIVSTRCSPSSGWLSSMIYCVSISCFCIGLCSFLAARLPWFLTRIDLAATLVQFTARGGAQGLAAYAGVNIIWHLSSPVRLGQVKASEWVILTQGVGCPVNGHQDTAQVRMAGKGDAKEIVYLSLIPVCSWPDAADGRYGGMLLTTLTFADFQAQFTLIGKREQMID